MNKKRGYLKISYELGELATRDRLSESDVRRFKRLMAALQTAIENYEIEQVSDGIFKFRSPDGEWTTTKAECTCPDRRYRRRKIGEPCKHMLVVQAMLD